MSVKLQVRLSCIWRQKHCCPVISLPATFQYNSIKYLWLNEVFSEWHISDCSTLSLMKLTWPWTPSMPSAGEQNCTRSVPWVKGAHNCLSEIYVGRKNVTAPKSIPFSVSVQLHRAGHRHLHRPRPAEVLPLRVGRPPDRILDQQTHGEPGLRQVQED